MYRKMNLQFFADGGEGDQNPQGNPEQVNTNPVNNPEQNNPNNNNPNQPQGTVFSQEEVNSLLAREKAQGRAALLRELGFEKEDDLKGIVTKYNEQKEAGMTAEQKLNAQNKTLTESYVKEKTAREAAEAKVAAMKAGVNPSLVDDFVILAMAKKTDGKDFDTVIAEMKVSNAFYFENNNSDKEDQGTKGRGTRGTVKPEQKQTEEEKEREYVKGLLNKNAKRKESYYFK